MIHGWKGTSQSHWFPWIAGELESRGYTAILPDLPNTDFPVMDVHVESVRKFQLKKGDLIIGHSLRLFTIGEPSTTNVCNSLIFTSAGILFESFFLLSVSYTGYEYLHKNVNRFFRLFFCFFELLL